MMAASRLYGIVGALLALPAIAIISATIGYLRDTLLFEPWPKPPVSPADEPEQSEIQPQPADDRDPEYVPATGQPRAPTFPGDRRGRLG